ncbi:hypothetical protein KSP39_PZI000714 [Platanthera zijinensis]|uniref:Uncharacterized protein n=1 Tax=Platanthera zijinensis TaxID=2320716 RepID=A0AAP0C3D0_9ASPA
MGRLRLIPRILALKAVQRQTAASKSARPARREQQGCLGGLPRFRLMRPSTSAHTPSLSASRGHRLFPDGGPVVGADGVDGVLLQPELQRQVPQELSTEKNRRLRMRKRENTAAVDLCEAMELIRALSFLFLVEFLVENAWVYIE